MDIENVFVLGKQLQDIGFGDLSGKLAKQICFQPQSFTISHTVQYDETWFSFHVTFGLDEKLQYVGQYFDAAIAVPTQLPDMKMNDVDASILDERMSRVDWRKAFDFAEAAALNPTDKNSWVTEEKIDAIVKDLKLLEGTAEGKRVANHLKEKHWRIGVPFNNVSSPKRKPEISQRFYFTDGRQGITVEEACRFLMNCQWEKQMTEQRKRQSSNETDSKEVANSNGANRKRRSSKGTKGKKRQTDNR